LSRETAEGLGVSLVGCEGVGGVGCVDGTGHASDTMRYGVGLLAVEPDGLSSVGDGNVILLKGTGESTGDGYESRVETIGKRLTGVRKVGLGDGVKTGSA